MSVNSYGYTGVESMYGPMFNSNTQSTLECGLGRKRKHHRRVIPNGEGAQNCAPLSARAELALPDPRTEVIEQLRRRSGIQPEHQ